MNTSEASNSRQKKRILVLNYSQTGQLTEIVNRIVAPLEQDESISVRVETLRPLRPFPFPWGFFSFLDAFPESAHMVPPPLEPLTLTGDEDFDLVILPYQVWFLAPSQPVTAFLKHPVAKKLLAGKPVVTVIGCRNMWMLAQEKMKALLDDCGARLLDNVALVDPSPTMASLWTTPLWLLSGKKDFLKLLPPAGVDAASIQASRRFGLALRDALHKDQERGTCAAARRTEGGGFQSAAAVQRKGRHAQLLRLGQAAACGGRAGAVARYPFLILYVTFLITLILTVVPLSLLHPVAVAPVHAAALRGVEAAVRPAIGFWYREDAPV